MNIEGIIAVTGKPGLYKVVGQTKNGVIVEGLADSKKFAMNSTSKMSALQDIAIYTYTEEVPLVDVLDKIRVKLFFTIRFFKFWSLGLSLHAG